VAAAVITTAHLVAYDHAAGLQAMAGRAVTRRVGEPAAINGLDEFTDAGHEAIVG
jgi:hypothetical protein